MNGARYTIALAPSGWTLSTIPVRIRNTISQTGNATKAARHHELPASVRGVSTKGYATSATMTISAATSRSRKISGMVTAAIAMPLPPGLRTSLRPNRPAAAKGFGIIGERVRPSIGHISSDRDGTGAPARPVVSVKRHASRRPVVSMATQLMPDA
ncbi:hypothetical protein LuPra_00149 [Luteitalea pratensis]|uniref:Uncharacterized protein n=1 Tax=Luteitalea pratensis TaxID=1855912 RepID=A0A143PEP0_LUTPR|nr:hypothetical protein [Luteitalea pratensis]AMY06985.1 hypothetical protein LuPra_00149 [Luteitalea pratensis]